MECMDLIDCLFLTIDQRFHGLASCLREQELGCSDDLHVILVAQGRTFHQLADFTLEWRFESREVLKAL